ncbi:MAG TPA: maleylpyruvate isomerase N-terminal domain-containing protein [Vicinamibacteria bacterium]|nr:maleylpyruvate isomerase N-terminal domain-containing protein [Vicinamibacteria bacterium]
MAESLAREWKRFVEAIEVRDDSNPLSLAPDKRMPFSRLALVAQLEEVRDEWANLRHRIQAETGARFVNSSWTLKDLLAHLASWAREFRKEIETVVTHRRFDYAIPFAMGVVGPNEWNQAEVEARRELSLDSIFDEFDEETIGLMRQVIEMDAATLYGTHTFPLAPSGDPSAPFRGPSAFIVFGKCLHDLHHIEQIKSRLPRLKR